MPGGASKRAGRTRHPPVTNGGSGDRSRSACNPAESLRNGSWPWTSFLKSKSVFCVCPGTTKAKGKRTSQRRKSSGNTSSREETQTSSRASLAPAFLTES